MKQMRGESSNPLIALVVMAVCAFAVVMYNVHLDKKRNSVTSDSALNKIAQEVIRDLESSAGGSPQASELANDTRLQGLIDAMQSKQQLQLLVEKHSSTTDAPVLFGHALQLAIDQGNVEAIELLLSAGAVCDASTKLGSQLIGKAVASSNSRFAFLLSRNDCGWTLGETKSQIIQQIMASDYPKRVEYLATDAEMMALRPQLLMRFIQAKKTDEAISLLYEGASPNAVTTDGKTTALELSIQNKLTDLAVQLIELNADSAIEQRDFTRYAIVAAQDYRQIDIARALLQRDSDQLKQQDLAISLLEGLRGFANTNDISSWLQLLLDHGVTLDTAPGVDVSLLRKAINNSDFSLTKRLLELGADANTVLITTTLLSEAKALKSESGQQIVRLLEQHDAVDDVLLQVRRKRPSSVVDPCDLGDSVSIPKLAEAQEKMQSFIRGRDKNKAPNTAELCKHAIKYCTDNGVSEDDCLTTLPTCSQADEGQYTLCCKGQFKHDYFKGRCAGLTPSETLLWQNSYSLPGT